MATFQDTCPPWEIGVNRIPTSRNPISPWPDGMGAVDVELTLETNTVTLQAIHGLSEEVLSSSRHSGDIVLFPLNGSVDVFEDLLYGVGNFSSDTITWNQGDLGHIEP